MTTYANRSNLDLIDSYYASWKQDANSVDETWSKFFEGFEFGLSQKGGNQSDFKETLRQSKVDSLVYAYRSIGHTAANIDPLTDVVPPNPVLSLSEFGLSEEDLDCTVDAGHFMDGGPMKLATILEGLHKTYCGKIGIEYIYIQNIEARRWIQQRLEPTHSKSNFSYQKKIRILRKIYAAETFERFIHTRYVGQKRFSLEGGETLIPCLDGLIEHCAELGMKEAIVGMAHRGRLNVLANTIKKSYDFIFEEFAENYIQDTVAGDGDVKYHLGYKSIVKTRTGKEFSVRLSSNPSHLEAINPVVQGKARARQRLLGDTERKLVIPVLIHGDAAFAGQGIVAETFNFSQLPGYRTGGTIHIVVNNQIGFTTTPDEARSSRYCTDFAKIIHAPIIHVNGDSPLEVVFATELAVDFRQKFQRDVVIDMVCYRRHGHNETDEPLFTQPVLYQKIAKHPHISQILTKNLIDEGTLTQEDADKIQAEYQESLEKSLTIAKKKQENENHSEEKFKGSSAIFQPNYSFNPVKTRVSKKLIAQTVKGLTIFPEGFEINPKIKRFLETRSKAFKENNSVDWSYGEALAFGTLLLEGTPVRLSGQDSERGTFSQRHAVIRDRESLQKYVSLKNLSEEQAQFCVYNSLLSEAAVLGFDFGYSLDYPQMLCIWEAQFGDFANGAQVIIDQFITSSESKWQRASSIVLLLPHGYEGQGPEHSSARLERFLQACAEDNIQVCNLTTPAQYFHALRRQKKRNFHKPLIIMAPKSLLRSKEATSPWKDFTSGSFQEIIANSSTTKEAKRVILCSGKVYYDLKTYQTANNITDVTIVRIEQLYPLHTKMLQDIFTHNKSAKTFVWCQEESKNMGAWSFIAPQLEEITGQKILFAGRGPSASPAVGSLARHKIETNQFLKDAFTLL
jgi:2-oxoglutarate dehydrogenase E1 component